MCSYFEVFTKIQEITGFCVRDRGIVEALLGLLQKATKSDSRKPDPFFLSKNGEHPKATLF